MCGDVTIILLFISDIYNLAINKGATKSSDIDYEIAMSATNGAYDDYVLIRNSDGRKWCKLDLASKYNLGNIEIVLDSINAVSFRKYQLCQDNIHEL